MKVLFSDTTYSYLFPGGKQVHVNQMYKHLSQLGIEVAYENWHCPDQHGELVQFFGYNAPNNIRALKKKGYKLVYTHIMDGLTNKTKTSLLWQKIKNSLIRFLHRHTGHAKLELLFPWLVLSEFDRIIYMHENDRQTAVDVYKVDLQKTEVIPHAVDDPEKYRGAPNLQNDTKYLVSLGTIGPRKNSLFTAELCAKHNVPVKFIGPADEKSSYFKKFLDVVNNSCVEYLGFLSEENKIEIMKNASGFILLSYGESGCISVYEAAVTGLPLLLSDLPWAKGYEKPVALTFCPIDDIKSAGNCLEKFFKNCKRSDVSSCTVRTWLEIAQKYKNVYSQLIHPNAVSQSPI